MVIRIPEGGISFCSGGFGHYKDKCKKNEIYIYILASPASLGWKIRWEIDRT